MPCDVYVEQVILSFTYVDRVDAGVMCRCVGVASMKVQLIQLIAVDCS